MPKAIMNPLDPDIGWAPYERYIGDMWDAELKQPGGVKQYFSSWTEDLEMLEALSNVRLRRRTKEKPHWLGASGYAHQIDESFSSDGDKVVVLVECKHWNHPVGLPALSTFLVRLIDIGDALPESRVLGIITTTQGPQGAFGGLPGTGDVVEKLRTYFSSKGYVVMFQVVADVVIRETILSRNQSYSGPDRA